MILNKATYCFNYEKLYERNEDIFNKYKFKIIKTIKKFYFYKFKFKLGLNLD